jgi:PhnB protein
MKTIEAYLFFDGNCAEAMQFYESALKGTLRLVAVKDAPPDQRPPGDSNRIMHARLDSDGASLMASDWLSSDPYPGKSGFSVTLTAPTTAEAKGLFDKLADGGQVMMAFEKTFYSDGFGMLVDRFGTGWMVMSATSSQA